MALPYFFTRDLSKQVIELDEDTSKHVIGVLRMTKGEELLLTNGLGKKARAVISQDNRKKCSVQVIAVEEEKERDTRITIGISLIKNASRFEWFLEKATEIGVTGIIPLICARTEKERFRFDRMQQILVSAMLQSQQCWLPVLQEPVSFEKICATNNFRGKFIAHCLPELRSSLKDQPIKKSEAQLILIGPEGDFTHQEISLALQHDFIPVSLGNTRLRTETAGMVAATLLCVR